MHPIRPLLVLAALLAALAAPAAATTPPDATLGGRVFVANRATGTVSVIDVSTDTVMTTIVLPGVAPPEPMYVHYSRLLHRMFVGDRANDQVVAYDLDPLMFAGTAPTGQGVFHMWGTDSTRELWVNNDVDDTATVIDMLTLQALDTVPVPADLVADGGTPHDVILSPGGLFAYQTIRGVAGDNDFVVQYFAPTRQEVHRAAVGEDPHVSLSRRNPWLFVPCQDTDEVYVLSRLNLAEVEVLPVPGAHGAGMPRKGRFFYTTNLPGGGTDGLFAIDTLTLEVAGAPVDTPHPVPHNIAITRDTRKLYLTHSGAASDKVTVWRIAPWAPTPVFLTEITVGINPFGIAYAD